MIFRTFCAAALAAAIIGGSSPSFGDSIGGVVQAEVLQVEDGDTLRVAAWIWPGHTVKTLVRLNGIDTAELNTSRCPEERLLAQKALEAVKEMIGNYPVMLEAVSTDKYGGRMLAQVRTRDGKNVAEELLKRGLARVYESGKRQSWCTP